MRFEQQIGSAKRRANMLHRHASMQELKDRRDEDFDDGLSLGPTTSETTHDKESDLSIAVHSTCAADNGATGVC